jgi:hypothetical protein
VLLPPKFDPWFGRRGLRRHRYSVSRVFQTDPALRMQIAARLFDLAQKSRRSSMVSCDSDAIVGLYPQPYKRHFSFK